MCLFKKTEQPEKRRKILFASALGIGVVGLCLGTAGLIVALTHNPKQKQHITLSTSSNVLRYDASYTSVRLTAEFASPGLDWATWHIDGDDYNHYVPDGGAITTGHMYFYRDPENSSPNREVWYLRYSYEFTDKVKELKISCKSDNCISNSVSVFALKHQSSTNSVVTGNSVKTSLTLKTVDTASGDRSVVANTPADLDVIYDLINSSKGIYDFRNVTPWSKTIANYVDNDWNVRDVAMMFVLGFEERMKTAAPGTTNLINFYNIQKDDTNCYDLDIDASYAVTSTGSASSKNNTNWYKMQTATTDSSTYITNHATRSPVYAAKITELYSSVEGDDHMDAGHFDFVFGSGAAGKYIITYDNSNVIQGAYAKGGELIDLVIDNFVGEYGGVFDSLEDLLLSGTRLPEEAN